jgi:hypothetical protein
MASIRLGSWAGYKTSHVSMRRKQSKNLPGWQPRRRAKLLGEGRDLWKDTKKK